MGDNPRKSSASASLDDVLAVLLEKSESKDSLSMGEILEILAGKGRVLVLIFLSLPFCQPLQIPGLSIPFGLVVAFVGLRMASSQHAWLPKFLRSKKISSAVIQKISKQFLKIMRKMKRLIHPRLQWLCENRIMEISNALLIVILGVFLALPLPIPLTNLTAGWAIFFMGVGLLEKDGVYILISYFITLVTFIILTLLAISFKWVF